MIKFTSIDMNNTELGRSKYFVYGYIPSGDHIIAVFCVGKKYIMGEDTIELHLFTVKPEVFAYDSLLDYHEYKATYLAARLAYNLVIRGTSEIDVIHLLDKYCKENNVNLLNIEKYLDRKNPRRYAIRIEDSNRECRVQRDILKGLVGIESIEQNRYTQNTVEMLKSTDRYIDYTVKPNRGAISEEIEKIRLKQSLMGSDKNVRLFGDKLVYQVGDMRALLNHADCIVGDYSPDYTMYKITGLPVSFNRARSRDLITISRDVNLKATYITGVVISGGNKENLNLNKIDTISQSLISNLKINIESCTQILNSTFENCELHINNIKVIRNCKFINCLIVIKNCEYILDGALMKGDLELENKPQYINFDSAFDTAHVNKIRFNFRIDALEVKSIGVGGISRHRSLELYTKCSNRDASRIHMNNGIIVRNYE